MSVTKHRVAAATAVAAAFSLAATPAWAVELPRVAGQGQTWDAGALDAAEHRSHRGHHGGHWEDDDWYVDGGDVLAGVLILGGLAAIAGIAGSSKHREQAYPEQSYPEPEAYPDDAAFEAPAPEIRYRSSAMSEAVDTCVGEIETGRGPVGSVDRASRSGEGWYVAGELDGGTPYACWIDGAGRVNDIEAGDYSANYERPEKGDAVTTTVRKQAVDAVPGDDGRYEVAQASELAN